MKIVYCHNYYRNRGGEDVSFESDLEMLRERGHEVVEFTRNNRDMESNQLKLAGETLWNRHTMKDMAKVIEREKPDILHCNNLFPQISVSVQKAAHRAGVPVVQAIRNYRSMCANSFFFREGSPCLKCQTSSAAWHGLVHRCYRDSLPASAVVVSLQLWHRVLKVQKKYVDAFFCPTHFARQVHLDAGYSPEKLFVRSNFLLPDLGAADHGTTSAEPPVKRPVVFVGRFSDEKGIETVLDAWIDHRIDWPLRLIGSGPLDEKLRAKAANDAQITFAGQLDSKQVLEEVGQARVVLMPSLWFETFGRTIAESFSRGTPVIGSRLGAMKELIDDGINGYTFKPGDAHDLHLAVSRLIAQTEEENTVMRAAARQSYESHFTPQRSYEQLQIVYEHAIKNFAAARAQQPSRRESAAPRLPTQGPVQNPQPPAA